MVDKDSSWKGQMVESHGNGNIRLHGHFGPLKPGATLVGANGSRCMGPQQKNGENVAGGNSGIGRNHSSNDFLPRFGCFFFVLSREN